MWQILEILIWISLVSETSPVVPISFVIAYRS